MKKVYSLLTMAVIAAMSLAMTSCDGDDYCYDLFCWYDHYDDWGWNNNDWNNGWQGGSQNNDLVDMARLLTGEWYGPVTYSYLSDDGQSRQTDEFYVDMTFFQYANTRDALRGECVETDYVYNDDGSVAVQQTLEFKWYIDDNYDIYIQYKNSGATFVMDHGSSQAGFHLGAEKGYDVDTFWGYMIGTGKVKGDILYINLLRQNTVNNSKVAKVQAKDGTKKMVSFGDSSRVYPLLKATAAQLNHRR